MTGLRWLMAMFSAVSAVQMDEFAADRHRRLAASRLHAAVGRRVIAVADDLEYRAAPADRVEGLRDLMAEVARRADR